MKRILPFLMLLSALSLAATAAYYSIFGLSKLFSAQETAVIIMASILEMSKLIAASYLHRHWANIKWITKTYFAVAVIVLMSITSLGIYGFMVSSYQETAYKMSEIESKVSVLDLKKSRYTANLGAIQAEKQSLNTNISELTKGLSNNVISYVDDDGNRITTTSRTTRKTLQEQLDLALIRRDKIAGNEIAISDSINSIEMQIFNLKTNNDVVAELGPLTYIANILQISMDRVVNWFILLFIIVFDPLAIIMLISANKLLLSKLTISNNKFKEKNTVSDSSQSTNEKNENIKNELPTDTPNKKIYKPPSLHNVWRSAAKRKKNK